MPLPDNFRDQDDSTVLRAVAAHPDSIAPLVVVNVPDLPLARTRAALSRLRRVGLVRVDGGPGRGQMLRYTITPAGEARLRKEAKGQP